MIRSLTTDNWITILFVLLIGVLVLLNYLFSVKFKDFIPFFKKEQFYIKYFKTFTQTNLFFLLFSIFDILIYSFLIYKIYVFYKKPEMDSHLLVYIKILNITFWYIILRFFIGKILDRIFKIKNFNTSLLYYKWIYLSKNALYLFPFLILLHYYKLNFSFIFLAVIVAIILVYNYFILLHKNQKNIFKHLFYFILYLCTLEIAPLIIYLKIVYSV